MLKTTEVTSQFEHLVLKDTLTVVLVYWTNVEKEKDAYIFTETHL